MSIASIDPTIIGATTYRIEGAVGVFVALVLNVPISAPFPAFDLKYPAAAKPKILLINEKKEIVGLDGETYAEFPAFTNRLVSTSLFSEGDMQTLTCEIKASAAAGPYDSFFLNITGQPDYKYFLTQLENNQESPTIKDIVCFRAAKIEVSGDAINTESGWKAHEKGVVTLKAVGEMDAQLHGNAGTEPLLPQKYFWKHDGSIDIPEFAESNKKQTISFFAPPVNETRNMLFEAEITFGKGTLSIEDPNRVDLFKNKAAVSVMIEPLGADSKIDKEIFISYEDVKNPFPRFLIGPSQKILAVWFLPEGQYQTFISQLDQYNPLGNFKTASLQITNFSEIGGPDAAPLPGGKIAIIYVKEPGILCFKKGLISKLISAPELNVVDGLSEFSRIRIIYAKEILFCFYYQKGWFFRRYSLTQEEWLDLQPVKVFEDNHSCFQVVVDEADNALWLASSNDQDFSEPENDMNISCKFIKLSLTTGQKLIEESRLQQVFGNPAILLNKSRDVWFFWRTLMTHSCWRAQNDVLEMESLLPEQTDTFDVPNNMGPIFPPEALVDSQGGIWLFWDEGSWSTNDPENWKTYFSRREPDTGIWLNRQFLGKGSLTKVLITENDTLWLFGNQFVKADESEEINLEPEIDYRSFFRRIFTKF